MKTAMEKRLLKAMANDPLVRAFVIDALMKQSSAVLTTPESEWPRHCIVAYDAWQRAAMTVSELL
jgi:hypothetical protein